MGKTFRESLNEQLRDPEFKEVWDSMALERQIRHAIIAARIENNLTQAQLAERTGISQADISKYERGTAHPSLKTLQRLADGMDLCVQVRLVKKAAAAGT